MLCDGNENAWNHCFRLKRLFHLTFCLRLQGADLYLRVRPASENKQRDGEKEREGEGKKKEQNQKKSWFLSRTEKCAVSLCTLGMLCVLIACLFSWKPLSSANGHAAWGEWRIGWGGGIVLYDVPRLSGGPHPSARPLPGYDLSVSPTHGASDPGVPACPLPGWHSSAQRDGRAAGRRLTLAQRETLPSPSASALLTRTAESLWWAENNHRSGSGSRDAGFSA